MSPPFDEEQQYFASECMHDGVGLGQVKHMSLHGCQSRTMCVQCINLTMQGIPDQSHCQLKLSSMGEEGMAKQPIMINQQSANLAILS